MAEQMRRQSRRGWLFMTREVNAASAISGLRDAITLGDFDDMTRAKSTAEAEKAAAAIKQFVDDLDAALYGWMS